MENKAANRIAWIDMAKGYGTLLVIFAHLGDDPLRGWMYSFHLPVFFFLSGYVFRYEDSFKEFLKKKYKAIIVPYFCLGIPMMFFELLKDIVRDEFYLRRVLSLGKLLLEQRRLWTLWYIACLFWLNILFYFLLKICKKNWLLLVLSVIFPIVGLAYYHYGGQPLYWNIDTCFMALPFFAGGYLYRLYAPEVDVIVEKYKLLLVVVFGAMNIVAWKLSLGENGWGLEMFDSNYGKPIYTYIAAFAGCFFVILLAKCLVIEGIRFLGENSMLYYAWHQTIMMPVVAKLLGVVGADGLQGMGLYGSYGYKVLWLLGIVAVTTVCYFVIMKLKMQFILGKR